MSVSVCPQPKISNVVATFNCGKTLDLLKFAQLHGFEFQPSRFAACSIRIRSEGHCRSTALAFTSGKFVVTGARSEQESLLSSRKYIAMLNRLGERLSFQDFSIQNIVSSVDFGHPLKLHEIVQHTDSCSWEQRKFPGLVMRDEQSKLVVLIFRSGRCVITGSKSRRQLEREWVSRARALPSCFSYSAHTHPGHLAQPRLYAKIAKFVDYENTDKCSRAYAARLRRENEQQPFDLTPMF
jgi:transcription initiation factor TFIID TATA-box-binding protein